MIMFLDGSNKFHNLTVISLLPDTIKLSYFEIRTENTVSKCLPIIVFLNEFCRPHNLTVLSELPDAIKDSLSEIQTANTGS